MNQTIKSNNPINLPILESEMLNMDQAECPVHHHFFPGIYIREVHLKAGLIAIGHKQKLDHLNIMLSGKVAIIDGGEIKVLEAPLMFMGKPGKKVGYIMEDCVWQNIYSTTETNVDILEETYLDKSEEFLLHNGKKDILSFINSQEDREDYELFLSENGIDEEKVFSESCEEGDMIEMPSSYISLSSVRESSIKGNGLFASTSFNIGDIVAPARLSGYRTVAGRYVNHSKRPNCEWLIDGDNIYLVAKTQIHGCQGGGKGTELTVDYRDSVKIQKHLLGAA